MLFGFGDSYPADPQVVSQMDAVVQGYMRDLALRALRVADARAGQGYSRLDKECFLFAVRRESSKVRGGSGGSGRVRVRAARCLIGD